MQDTNFGGNKKTCMNTSNLIPIFLVKSIIPTEEASADLDLS